MGAPVVVANGACVREFGSTNKKTVMERVIKYWLRIWAVQESNTTKDALIFQLEGRDINWLGKI
jgi:hypothetical protein